MNKTPLAFDPVKIKPTSFYHKELYRKEMPLANAELQVAMLRSAVEVAEAGLKDAEAVLAAEKRIKLS